MGSDKLHIPTLRPVHIINWSQY